MRRRLDRAVGVARPEHGPRGPDAVLASLLHGLRAQRHALSLNPRRLKGSGGAVGVLANVDALSEAIAWRRESEHGRLLAGPNLVVLPSDAPKLMMAPEIDVCLVPSEWVKRLYEEDTPALRGRIAIWPAGVNTDYWRPDATSKHDARRALIYAKHVQGQRNATEAEVHDASQALAARGFRVRVLRYGSLRPRDYRAALRNADVLVFFSPTESQCLALVEAWSVGTPTLVWACGRLNYKGRTYSGSSAPYLTADTGVAFRDSVELESLLAQWEEMRPQFRPRAWVLENMSDEICARQYWQLAHEPSPTG